MNKIKERLSEVIHIFGYTSHESMPDNKTDFFEMPKDDKHKSKFMSFRDINDDMINWVCSVTDQDMEDIQYEMADNRKNVEIMSVASSFRSFTAINHRTSTKLYGKPIVHCDWNKMNILENSNSNSMN